MPEKENGMDDVREAPVHYDSGQSFAWQDGYAAGVAEGIRQAREAVAAAEGVTFHMWRPEGEDYPSVVIHGEDAAKAVVLNAIDALGPADV